MSPEHVFIIVLLVALLGLCIAIYARLGQTPGAVEGYYAGEYYKLQECRCRPQYDEFQTSRDDEFRKAHPDYL